MGVYVYTARATGRVRQFVDGDYHWVFPYKYAYKVNFFYGNTKEAIRAFKQAVKVESHKDWEGYVSIDGMVYRNAHGLWHDSQPVGELVYGPQINS